VGVGLTFFVLTVLASGLSAGPLPVKKANQSPTLSITSAASDDALIAPATIIMTADASDAGGTIKSVKFYAGSRAIGSASKPP